MPRVISGSAKKCILASLPGVSTRPTSDRIKESMFNILSYAVCNANVLDLFSGTGALGIEALSRGASRAVFADSSAACVKIIQNNLTKTGLSEKSEVLKNDAVHAIGSLADQFNLIFMDPPYGKGLNESALKAITESGILSDDGIIVIEAGSDEQIITKPFKYDIFDHRDYGRTGVYFLRKSKNIVENNF